jgi:hypothetical protein
MLATAEGSQLASVAAGPPVPLAPAGPEKTRLGSGRGNTAAIAATGAPAELAAITVKPPDLRRSLRSSFVASTSAAHPAGWHSVPLNSMPSSLVSSIFSFFSASSH